MGYFYDHLDYDIKAILLAQIRDLWTHNSTSLEGNSLTLGETSFILEEGLTIHGKPLKDHNEIYGHAKAIEIIYSLLKSDTVTRQDIFKLHRTVLTEYIVDIDQPVGKWKSQPNYTSVVDTNNKQVWREYPLPRHIQHLMSQWLDDFNQCVAHPSESREETANVYAHLHLTFVSIHPFFDGNGRMARLLANLPVLKAGFPPIVVPEKERYQYKLAISNYQNTIINLPDTNDLRQFPDNNEKQLFVDLCKLYWGETLILLDNAKAIQQKRI
jgi:Fic family protein